MRLNWCVGLIIAMLALDASAQDRGLWFNRAPSASIASEVSGGTANSVLFVGSTGLLDDSTDLTYNDTTKRFQVGSGSGATTTGFLIGNYGFSGSYAALWVTTVTAASGNYALAVNATETRLNAPTGGQVFAGVNGTAVVTVSSSSITAAQPILIPNGGGGAAALGFSTQPTSGLVYVSSTDWRLMSAGADVVSIRTYTGDAVSFRDRLSFNTSMGASDLFLIRGGPNVFEQRNGTNAQTFNIDNTYTDDSNRETGGLQWSGNRLILRTAAAGTGTARDLSFATNNARRWDIGATSGHLVPAATDTYDIGASSGNKVRALYVTNGFATNTFQAGTNFFLTGVGDLYAVSAGIMALRADGGGGAVLRMSERTAPSAPGSNDAYIYAKDNGSGKTQLCALFNTGAEQCFATEP